MDDLLKLEREVQRLYEDTLVPVAQRLTMELPVRGEDAPSRPMVLFLGNHSSGKSSFINHLIESDRQKTGLAPTDDGFTILTHGSKEDELDGQSVVSHPEFAYGRLEKLGPTFLSRLRLKTHPASLLQTISLVDSPGMIDAAGTANSRGYDFAAGVRSFAEMADLILFFFDPDKPGTTGETVSIFTETLVGLEHKLLIVLNKVDLFSNIRDFARTYGTLCWNLSKVMQTKDVPHIFNTFLPKLARQPVEGEVIPLKDFESSRQEIVAEIRRAPTRRADNLVSDLMGQARLLSMQSHVSGTMSRHFLGFQWKCWAATGLLALGSVLGAVWLWQSESLATPLGILFGGIALATAVWFGGRLYVQHLLRLAQAPHGLDPYFETAYRQELLWQDRADLRTRWERARANLMKTLELKGASGLPRGFAFRRQLKRLDHLIETQAPKLRRRIADHLASEAKGEAADSAS